jgi:hypothetical protein
MVGVGVAGSGVAGSGVAGSGVAGAGVTGAGVAGAGVTGAGVTGAGVGSGAGAVVGAGVGGGVCCAQAGDAEVVARLAIEKAAETKPNFSAVDNCFFTELFLLMKCHELWNEHHLSVGTICESRYSATRPD